MIKKYSKITLFIVIVGMKATAINAAKFPNLTIKIPTPTSSPISSISSSPLSLEKKAESPESLFPKKNKIKAIKIIYNKKNIFEISSGKTKFFEAVYFALTKDYCDLFSCKDSQFEVFTYTKIKLPFLGATFDEAINNTKLYIKCLNKKSVKFLTKLINNVKPRPSKKTYNHIGKNPLIKKKESFVDKKLNS
ncbi:MAG: hypothetical protein V1855_02120 [bacterium]